MSLWIAENAVTVIAMISVAVVIGLAVFSLVRRKKKSPCGCPGNCAGCRMCSERQDSTK